MSMRVLLATVVGFAAAGSAGATAAAQSALPPSLEAGFPAEVWAEDMSIPVNSPDAEIVCVVREFENATIGRIRIEWQFDAGPGASRGKKTETHELAFKPTSVCQAAGTATSLFVVGWSERSSATIVEEWTFSDFALGTTVSPSGKEISTLAGPNLRRSIVLASTSVPPIACAAFNPYTKDLYLLGSESPRVIRSLDVETGELAAQPLATEQEYPVIATHRSILTGKSTWGFVVVTEPRPRWISGSVYTVEPYQFFWMRDMDFDGTFDVTDVQSASAFRQMHLGTWDFEYAAP